MRIRTGDSGESQAPMQPPLKVIRVSLCLFATVPSCQSKRSQMIGLYKAVRPLLEHFQQRLTLHPQARKVYADMSHTIRCPLRQWWSRPDAVDCSENQDQKINLFHLLFLGPVNLVGSPRSTLGILLRAYPHVLK